jgi:hypothetical protein
MKPVTALLFSAVILLTASITAADAPDSAVRVPLEKYLAAHASGDGKLIVEAFHPDARIIALRDGKLGNMGRDQYVALFNGQPAPNEAQRKRWIESVRVDGDLATGVIVLDYPHARYVDHMALLRLEGGWVIVAKTAQVVSKPRS